MGFLSKLKGEGSSDPKPSKQEEQIPAPEPKTEPQSSTRKPSTTNTNVQYDAPPPPSYEEVAGPQLALNLDFVCPHPISLQAQSRGPTSDFTIVDGSGNQLFEVDCPRLSTLHEMNVVHSPSQTHLFTIERKAWTVGFKYFAELDTDGAPIMLFQTETSESLFSSGMTRMTFRNAVTGQQDQLDVELHQNSESVVMYKNKRIADIDRTAMISTNIVMNIHVPGIDPLLIIVLAMVIHDRIKTKHQRRSRNGMIA